MLELCRREVGEPADRLDDVIEIEHGDLSASLAKTVAQGLRDGALTRCNGTAALPTTEATTPTSESTSKLAMEVDFESGEITAQGLNELIDARRPSWANTASGVAEMLVQVEGGGETEVRADGDSTVVVTITDLADDSVEAVRYELRFRRGDDDLFRFMDGDWSQQCRPGRGHDDRFLPEPCV